MTVSSSQGRRFTVAKHISLAMKTAGLINAEHSPSEAEMGLGAELLETILDELQTHGVFARAVRFYNLTLTAGTYIYDLPDYAIEPIGTAMYIDPDAADITQANETVVTKMSREEWQLLSKDSESATPTRYYAHRAADPTQVYLWPVPDANADGGTIRFQVHSYLADVDLGTATLDLEPFWSQYVRYALAAALAEAHSLQPQRSSYFAARAQQALQTAKAAANEALPVQAYVDHGVIY